MPIGRQRRADEGTEMHRWPNLLYVCALVERCGIWTCLHGRQVKAVVHSDESLLLRASKTGLPGVQTSVQQWRGQPSSSESATPKSARREPGGRR